MKTARALLLILAMGIVAPARAEQVAYPPGASVGLAPPARMAPSTRFAGFEDSASGSSIVIVEMPAETFGQIADRFTGEGMRPSGVQASGETEDVALPGGRPGKLLRGTQEIQGITFRKWMLLASGEQATAMVTVQSPQRAQDQLPDQAVEAALRTVSFRAPPSLDEQVSALPFRIGDSAGFRPVRVIGGSSVYFTDGPQNVVRDASQPVVVAAASLGQAPPAAQRETFARHAFASVAGLADLVVTESAMEERDGVAWSRLVGTARDSETRRPLHVEQVIRFTENGYVRVVGIMRDTEAGAISPRFRRFAESLAPR